MSRNTEGLIQNRDTTPDERREYARIAGKASGEARRRKRLLRAAAEYYMSLPVTDTRIYNRLAGDGVAPEDIDNEMAMVAGLTRAAIKGDAKAAHIVIDILGDSASAIQDVSEDDPITKSLKEISLL